MFITSIYYLLGVISHMIINFICDVKLVDPCRTTTSEAHFKYDSDDPLAVVLTPTKYSPMWRFARSLIIEGVDDFAGIGDIRIWPSEIDDNVVMVALSSPYGTALLEFNRAMLRNFAALMIQSVPLSEEKCVCSDEEIENFLLKCENDCE